MPIQENEPIMIVFPTFGGSVTLRPETTKRLWEAIRNRPDKTHRATEPKPSS